MANGEINNGYIAVPKWVVTILGTLCVLAFAGLVKTVIDVAVIKSDRFRFQDAVQWRDIERATEGQKFNSIERRLDRLEGNDDR